MPADIILPPIVTRSQLYDLVWRYESKAIADQCKIAGTLIWRLCQRWEVPKPGRGDWQRIQAGQPIDRPALAPWPGRDADPAVMHEGADGYGTIVPRKTRPKPVKRDRVLEWFTEERRLREEAEQRRQEEVFQVIAGPATRHVLVVEDWQAEHCMDLGMIGPCVHLQDFSSVELICRYVIPEGRRGQRLQVSLQMRNAPDLPKDKQEPTRGFIRYGKREAHVTMAEDRAAFVCSALAAGQIRAIELESVKSNGSKAAIRWAKLCTRTHDGVENFPQTS